MWETLKYLNRKKLQKIGTIDHSIGMKEVGIRNPASVDEEPTKQTKTAVSSQCSCKQDMDGIKQDMDNMKQNVDDIKENVMKILMKMNNQQSF